MKKLFFLLSFLLLGLSVSFAQTRAYKYLYSVKDDVKIPGSLSKGTIHYFTFTDNGNKCYLTNKDGMYRGAYGQHSYKYIGKKNGVLIYKEQNQNILREGEDMLYFSSDLKKMNWQSWMDNYFPESRGCTQVYEYVADPNAVDVPSQLY